MRDPKKSRSFAILLLISVCVPSVSCGPGSDGNPAAQTAQTAKETAAEGAVLVTNNLNLDFSKHLVTFIELGADRCIPCKAMQPIMREVETAFPRDVRHGIT